MRETQFRKLSVLTAMLSFVFAGAANLHAAEGVVTLNESVAVALERNGNLKALREEAGIGQAVRMKNGLLPNPVLDLEVETGALTGSSSEHRVSLGLSQEILTGGKREKRIAVADAEVGRYDRQIRDAERLLALEVKQTYFDLLLAQGRAGVVRKNQELNRRLLEVARERFEAGEVAEIEVNLARVEAARSEVEKAEAERDMVPVRQRLLSLMGEAASHSLQAAPAPEPAPFTGDLVALKALALERRPDLQALQSEVTRGEAEVALAAAERLPNLTAGLAFTVEKGSTELGGLEEKETDYLVGLKLSVPIPMFDRNQAGTMEAKARKTGSETRYRYARQSAEREIESAFAALTASDTALGLYRKEIIPQMTQNLDLVQQAYQYGEIDLLEVIAEQRKFIEASNNYLTALHQRQTAQARLEAALGIELNETHGGKR